jgi:para-aminobenzoate synthetase/4-amino-4-deoxychorismate lyase
MRHDTAVSSVPAVEVVPAARPDAARGVFETMLVLGGVAVAWPRHRLRLAASVATLYGGALAEALDARVAELAGGHEVARLRVLAVPSPDGVSASAAIEPLEPALVMPAATPALYPVAVAAGFGPHKLVDRGWLDRLEVAVPAGARPLLVAASGLALETTRANVFALRGETLETPPLDGAILPGVTRALLIEEARRLGLEVRERPLAAALLREADALLLTGSLRLLEVRIARGGPPAQATVAALREGLSRAVGWGGTPA